MHTREQAAEQGIESEVLLADEEVSSSIWSIYDYARQATTNATLAVITFRRKFRRSIHQVRFTSDLLLLANCSVGCCAVGHNKPTPIVSTARCQCIGSTASLV